MPNKLITENLSSVIRTKSRPGITFWNRLEGRPRADRFDRALRVEVRDPLWMLTRQWQMGEFRGDDAGSPIFTKVAVESSRLRKYQPDQGEAEPFNDGMPLEARVESMPLSFVQGGHEMLLDVRLLMGRQWLKLVQTITPAPAVGDEFIANYPIHAPDPTRPADAPTCAHPEAWSNFAAAAGRRMDGAKLYFYLIGGGGRHAYDGIAGLAGLEDETDLIAERFIKWFGQLFYQPAQESAWVSDRLEYQFACSAPERQGEKVFVAEEYFHGHLDWYNFDIDPARAVLGEPAENPESPAVATFTMLPTQVTFNGMPNTRWWAFEDSRTNFGEIKPDTTDLAKLLLIEFGLIYANDWFVVPFTLPAGAIANILGIAVTNVFGERTWVEAAGRGDDDDWQRWAMFLMSIKGKGHEPADLSLMIPPAAQKVIESRPLEEVLLARDEMANMVWAIEKTIALPSGEAKPGLEAAYETRAFFEHDLERQLGRPPPPVPPAEGAKIRFKVMSTVPENWIPMIPVHVAGDNRETQLQRAAMLRIIECDPDLNPPPPVPVRPRTMLLRQGLDQDVTAGYFVHEEEVPRAGVRLTESFQRTRWRHGRVLVWLGVRKQTGRGEGSSGLAFDRIVDVKPSGEP
jgi:hypothetical protein